MLWDAGIRLMFEQAFLSVIRSKKKPDKCPECGSWRIAGILYGMLSDSPRLHRDLDAGKIVLGGSVVTDNPPAWQCVNYAFRTWHRCFSEC